MKTKSFKDLIVWQKTIELVDEVYKIANQLPKQELYILVSQMLRAAISIPSNISEGYRRNFKLEFIHFLSIAIASAAELETQLIIAKRQYPNIDFQKADGLIQEVQKMIYVMIKNMKLSNYNSTLNASRLTL
jgi:four helix bundle protein